jgi:POT family proton-dependent oligopeptide transporter
MPVPWLQAIDSLGCVVLVAPLLMVWRRQAERGSEPGDLTKAGIGCLLFSGSVLWLAAADLVAGADGKVPLLWAVTFHFLSAVGWLYFAPIMIALVSRSAPASVNALMIGVYYLSIFVGSTISGRLGGLYEQLSPAAFWGVHAAIVGGAGAVLLALSGYLVRGLTPKPTPSFESHPGQL